MTSHPRPTEREVVPMSKFDTRTAVPSVDTSEPERPSARRRRERSVACAACLASSVHAAMRSSQPTRSRVASPGSRRSTAPRCGG